MKVLHITNWYRSEKEAFKVSFINEHLKSLNHFFENDLYHVEVQDDGEHLFKVLKGSFSNWENYYILKTKKIPWKLKEYLSSKLLLKLLKKLDVNKYYDIINIHTAYPLCSDIDGILRYLNIPLVFTEHWTAFAFNFNLPESNESLNRIRRIYQRNIPVFTVSNYLGQEIKRFSKNESLNYEIVPNVVDDEIFSFQNKPLNSNPSFFMVNYWREIKNPMPVLEAFKKFLKDYPDAILRIGGYGPLWSEMERFIEANKLEKNIILLGSLTKSQISDELQGITAFVHSAKFETFSVVCAEALCCGTPVVVSDLECIAEYLDKDAGILVKDDFYEALLKITRVNPSFNRGKIANKYQGLFSMMAVGKLYSEKLKEQMSIKSV